MTSALLLCVALCGTARAQSAITVSHPAMTVVDDYISLPAMKPITAGNCQLLLEENYRFKNEIIAIDEVTGAVLLHVHIGTILSEKKCVNAPNGHSLRITPAVPQ
jgi:hypothetical protein